MINMNDREPDEELVNLSNELEMQAVEYLKVNELQKSYTLYERMLKEIFKAQEKQNRPIHKGLPYHMMGVLHKIRNEDNTAIQYYLLAYIEDTLYEKLGEEDKADYNPAYYNIRGFAFDHKILNKIKSFSKDKKEKEIIVFTPKEIFDELELEKDKLLKYTTPDKLVFIGGDYFINSENITIIEKHVKSLGSIPIIPYYLSQSIRMPKNMDFQFSISWLHKCKKAIFSVVHGGGHYFEIMEFYNRGYNPLLIVHKFIGEKEKVEKLSGMIKTLGIKDIEEYTDPEQELKKIINNYL